jgi:hypothetical protein
LQPVRDTREKQIQLWKELILDYCKTQKVFVIGLEEEFPLFTNTVIESKLEFHAFLMILVVPVWSICRIYNTWGLFGLTYLSLYTDISTRESI